MRKYIIAGNWKMFKTRGEAINFLLQVADKVPSSELVDSVVCTQAPILRDCVKRQGDNLKVGAQNMHFKDSGAYTGETSALLLQELGVTYVIIGHSERRAMFNETDETVNLKIKQAFAFNLLPIGNLDGSKVLRWNFGIWIATIAVAAILTIASMTIGVQNIVRLILGF